MDIPGSKEHGIEINTKLQYLTWNLLKHHDEARFILLADHSEKHDRNNNVH